MIYKGPLFCIMQNRGPFNAGFFQLCDCLVAGVF